MIKWIYDIQLAYRKRRRDRIEKKYYKAFPDRVNDHFIATRPVPTFKVTKYHAVTLKSEVRIPRIIVENYGVGVKEIIETETMRNFAPEISKRLEIHTLTDPEEKDIITYEAYLRFYEED